MVDPSMEQLLTKRNLLPLLPFCIGGLPPLNFLLFKIGSRLPEFHFFFTEAAIGIVGIGSVLYLTFICSKSAAVYFAGDNAHPIDQWLLRHSGILALAFGIILISVVSWMVAHGPRPGTYYDAGLLTLSEVSLVFSLTYLFPSFIEQRRMGSVALLYANIFMATIEFALIVCFLLLGLGSGWAGS